MPETEEDPQGTEQEKDASSMISIVNIVMEFSA